MATCSRSLAHALACAVVLAAGCGPRTDPRPNVLLLVMDTTRADRCSFNGYGRPTTPRLSEFAADAVVCSDAWSPAAWTGPAHASLFTGLRPEHHGFSSGNRLHLGDEHPTLASSLAAAGYATACFVNNDWISPECGTSRGFARCVSLQTRGVRPYPWAVETHEQAAQWAEEQARRGQPFFLFVNDMEPHLRYAPRPQDALPFVRGRFTEPEFRAGVEFDYPQAMTYSLQASELSDRQLGLLSDLYDAEVASLDREIGVLLDRLARNGLLDRTLVVVAGDHGELLGEDHLISHGFSLHRAIQHVPLLLRLPKVFDGGRRIDSVVRLEDVMPTVLQVCGAPVPPGLDGASLLSDLGGRVALGMQDADSDTARRLEALVPGASAARLTTAIRSVYDGRHHLISYGDGRCTLFDVRRDPGETDDLASRDPGTMIRLLGLLRTRR